MISRRSYTIRLGVGFRDWRRAGQLCRDLHVPVVPVRIRVWRHGAVAYVNAWTGEVLEFAGSDGVDLSSAVGADIRQGIRDKIRTERSSW